MSARVPFDPEPSGRKLLPFPRAADAEPSSVLPHPGMPSAAASLDVLAEYGRIVAARRGGAPLAEPCTIRESLVRFAAEALMHLDDYDAHADERSRSGRSDP